MTLDVGEGTVVRDWLDNLTWKQQTVLLSAVRGCDGVSKHDKSKKFVRPMRAIVLKDAEPNEEDDTFMNHPPDDTTMEEFAHDLDDYPMHWVIHFLHAVEIVGYKHPNPSTREEWIKLYRYMALDGFHLLPETEERLDERLRP